MICLAAGLLSATLATNSFTLTWIHSIEKIRWEEDWHVDSGALVIDEARIRGTGAGMEPPENAVLKDGVGNLSICCYRGLWHMGAVGYILCFESVFIRRQTAESDLPEWRNGRRAGLKIQCPQGRVGSSPTSGTCNDCTDQ